MWPLCPYFGSAGDIRVDIRGYPVTFVAFLGALSQSETAKIAMLVRRLNNPIFCLGIVISTIFFSPGCAGLVTGQFLTPSSRLRFFAADKDFQEIVQKDPFPRAEQVGLTGAACSRPQR